MSEMPDEAVVRLDADLYAEYQIAKVTLATARDRVTELEGRLREALAAPGVNATGVVNDAVVLRLQKIESSRLDTRTFKRELPDVYRQYMKDADYWRFSAVSDG